MYVCDWERFTEIRGKGTERGRSKIVLQRHSEKNMKKSLRERGAEEGGGGETRGEEGARHTELTHYSAGPLDLKHRRASSVPLKEEDENKRRKTHLGIRSSLKSLENQSDLLPVNKVALYFHTDDSQWQRKLLLATYGLNTLWAMLPYAVCFRWKRCRKKNMFVEWKSALLKYAACY